MVEMEDLHLNLRHLCRRSLWRLFTRVVRPLSQVIALYTDYLGIELHFRKMVASQGNAPRGL